MVESSVGKGSRFTLFIPFSQASAPATPAVVLPADNVEVRLRDDALAVLATSDTVLPQAAVADDRAAIGATDQSVLIVEDDPIFARILLDTARDSGFKGVVTLQGSDPRTPQNMVAEEMWLRESTKNVRPTTDVGLVSASCGDCPQHVCIFG